MVSVQDTSAAFKYGLRTVTKDGVRNVRADEIFTATFLGELSQNDTGLSLESTLNELLAISSRVAGASGKVCPSGYGRETSMDANVVRYGVDAVIDVSEVKQAAKVLGSDGLGDYMSVGDALLVYSGATMMHKHAGAVFAKTKGKVGLKMVDESGKPTHETAMELYAYIEGLKANMANRDKHECTCGRVYPVEDMQAVMRRLAMVNPDSAALFSDPLRYEIRADGRVSRHLRGTCQLLSGKVGEPIFTVSYQGLRLAMRTGYDRWLHEKMRVCCVAQCCCWKLGVREAKESGWYVARNFLCNDRTVCGGTDMAKHALHAMGLKPQRADKNGMWYDYDPVVANRWLEGVMKTPPKKIIGGEIMHWKCSIVVFRMLIAWFDYIQNGKISLGDALHAVDFAESGDVLNVSVVTDGLYLTDGYDTRCG